MEVCGVFLEHNASLISLEVDGKALIDIACERSNIAVARMLTETQTKGPQPAQPSLLFSGPWGWLHRYRLFTRVADAFAKREELPFRFRTQTRHTVAIRTEMARNRSVLQDYKHEDNELFSLQMDEQIVLWFSTRPADLIPSSGRSVNSAIRLLIAAWDLDTHIEDTRRKLSAGFGLVADVCDIANQMVSLALLKKYDCVLFWTRQHGRFSDAQWDEEEADAIGNALAAFVDDGGVVVACFQTMVPKGRWASGNYLPFKIAEPSEYDGDSSSALESPAMAGLQKLKGRCRVVTGSLMSGKKATVMWTNGPPLWCERSVASGRVVFLNMYPPSRDADRADKSLWAPDQFNGARLMANAIRSGCGYDTGERDESSALDSSSNIAAMAIVDQRSYFVGEHDHPVVAVSNIDQYPDMQPSSKLTFANQVKF